MTCKQVKIVGGRYIDCESIEPSNELPGFFELRTGEGECKIINSHAIVEVLEGNPYEPPQITEEYLQKFYG